MRLIDADEAISTLENTPWYSLNKNGKLLNGSASDKVAFIHYLDTKKAINKQQTVDVMPVVHGHWEQKENMRCRCSNCHALKEQYHDLFCGNCGAKMNEDGEQDEN